MPFSHVCSSVAYHHGSYARITAWRDNSEVKSGRRSKVTEVEKTSGSGLLMDKRKSGVITIKVG
ncbi:hypothetical protein A2V82_02040 [candidate division KSB1 bacterium RBG_16_48_16]|nr:MAG: hypothetical protein A2V82_02040 [candidate division KSB1 bacterium RBG_16_48_16]